MRSPLRFHGPASHDLRHEFASCQLIMPSLPPPKGIYVPAVLFFRENEDLHHDGKLKFRCGEPVTNPIPNSNQATCSSFG